LRIYFRIVENQREKLVPADQRRKSRGSTLIFLKIGENQRYQSAKISGKKYPPADQRRKSLGSMLIFLKIGENQREKVSSRRFL
jgi:hypothetical protein